MHAPKSDDGEGSSGSAAAGSLQRSRPDAPPDRPTREPGIGRFGVRALLGWGALVAGAVPFVLLWFVVAREWPPAAGADDTVAASLNEAVRDLPWLVTALEWVTDLGGSEAGALLFGLATLFFALRRHWRLAAFVAVTGAGVGVLVPTTKAWADRARPVVDAPVVALPGSESFPSGHAATSLVAWGALLVVTLPAVRRWLRPWLVAGTTLLVVAVGFTRLALGVHFLSDVLAGWALGGAWLAVTTAAFRAWQHDRGRPSRDRDWDPLDAEESDLPELAPALQPALPAGRRTAIGLGTAAITVFVVVAGLGLLITGPLSDTVVGEWDRQVAESVVALRTPTATDLVEVVGMLAGTPAVVTAILTLSVVGLAVGRSWRPVVFVLLTIVGEALLHLATSQVVGRMRPPVEDLTTGLPTAAGWPSGHAAAACAVFGAAATLVVVYARSRWRWAAVAVPVLVAPAVSFTRVYVGTHHPSDVVAGILLGTAWVLVCARLVMAGTTPPGRVTAGSTPTS